MTYTFDPQVQFDPVLLDRIYQDAFGYKTDGAFVEVGAYDGKSYSHTVGLANLGWWGVYIEPVPELAQRCRNNHQNNKRIQVWECAAGKETGHQELHIDEFSCCGSTLNPNVCTNPTKIMVPVRTLDSILIASGVRPGFELLSIDVEFAECEVLAGFTLEKWMPKLVIIELCEYHDEPKHTWAKPARDMCNFVFPAFGYTKIWADSINSIFALHA